MLEKQNLPDAPPDAAIAIAIAELRAGEGVIYPTETFYGIAADAFAPAALERIFEIKGRDTAKTIALIAHDAAAAFAIAREVPATARRLADAFWPGPLTIVMPARSGIPESLIGPDGGVGVRVSSHPIACALAHGLGRPITATSANRSGEAPARTIGEARAALGDKVKVFVEGGTLPGGAPSTVVQCDRDGWRLLRAGAIGVDKIEAALSVGLGARCKLDE
ncbi:MAG TPA: L-threonylcarbamoyladenylate synthase [Candidatus Binataceae bacterium]|jgi:L-threonylcarbamoyladenylate synthase|nr:L-threonylcarbamoyladenylate synthase [Candidatus Binataceae bacterium]